MMPRLVLRSAARYTQRGFAVISAIFILVVLAALGGFILSVSTNQQVGSALDVQGARAYEAARSGVEWGLYRQLRDGVCAASTSIVPTASTLSAFTVTVTCVATAGTNGAPTSYRVQATACNLPQAGNCPNTGAGLGLTYIERRVDVSF